MKITEDKKDLFKNLAKLMKSDWFCVLTKYSVERELHKGGEILLESGRNSSILSHDNLKSIK